jgi:dihydrofolate reductase
MTQTTATRPAGANPSQRRIIGAVFQSLDGVMQSPGAPTEDSTGAFDLGGWMTSYFDDTAGQAIGVLFARPFALLFGRKSYEMLAAHWPYVTGEAAALGAAFTTADKYVLTRGDDVLEWENSHRLSDINAVRELKGRKGPDLVIQGSASIYPQLLAAGLIDELMLFSFPVVLGRGKRLFGDGTPHFALRLIDHQVSQSGAMIGRYAPAGDIPLGSFGLDEPSAREVARRRRMQREG